LSAILSELVPSSHGRTAVPTPNMSAPIPRIVCQYTTEKRKWSRIVLPSTFSVGL
jgi:hypothetical protein